MYYNRRRTNSIFILILLLFGMGIGYALLSSDLGINGVATIDHATWNIHFDTIEETEGSITPNTETVINTPTSLSFDITLEKPGDYYDFLVDVVNEGTIDAMIDGFTFILNNDVNYEAPSFLKWSLTYDDFAPIQEHQLLKAGTTEVYRVHVEYRTDINPEDLPQNDGSISFQLDVVYVQAGEEANPRDRMAVIGVTNENDTSAFRSSTYKANIKTITLENELNPPADAIESWDIGDIHNGDVMAYVTPNSEDNTKYDLIIQGNGHLYANPDSSWLFYDLTGVDELIGIDNLDTSLVTNMSEMFAKLGSNSQVFTLDLGDHFDTSNVTNMFDMFFYTGYNSPVFTLDLGPNFDTSKVTDMAWMFDRTGFKSTVFTLDLGDKFDTSQVTTMEGMFYYSGNTSTSYTLNLGDQFNTSQVTNMSNMFQSCGENSPVFTLDLGDQFDTSQVTTMKSMFYMTGQYADNFTLDLGLNFDTSKVTDMSRMFEACGHKSEVFTLDLGDKFDTSNVTNMYCMFESFATRSLVVTLDLGDRFDTSKVTNMSAMFMQSISDSPVFTLDLGDKFDTSNVTNMSYMFYNFAPKSEVFTLDLGDKFDTSKVTNMKSMFSEKTGAMNPNFTLDLGDKFDTSNVTNMESMFDFIAYNFPTGVATQFTLDLGDKFDTSKVTNMKRMFSFVGFCNPNFTLDLGDKFNTSKVTNMENMFGGVGNANPNFVLDLSRFDFDQVTSYDGLFGKGAVGWSTMGPFSSTQKIYVKNSDDVEWIVTKVGADATRQNSFLTRDNVLVKP